VKSERIRKTGFCVASSWMRSKNIKCSEIKNQTFKTLTHFLLLIYEGYAYVFVITLIFQ